MSRRRPAAPIPVYTLRQAQTLSVLAVLKRFVNLTVYTLWLLVITYTVNVLFNLVELIVRGSILALFNWPSISHALLIDQVGAFLLELPGYIVPLVAAGVASVYLVYAIVVEHRERKHQILQLNLEMDAVQQQIDAYNDAFGLHILRDHLVPFVRRRPRPVRPKPTEEEKRSHDKNQDTLADLKQRLAKVDKSEHLKRFDQITQWLDDDEDLVDLTDNFIRNKRQLADLAGATVAPVLVIIASRLLATLLSH